MPDTPLNPDALANLRLLADRATEEVRHAVIEPDILHKLLDVAEVVAQPVAQKLTDAEWQEFQAIPDQGYPHRAWVDARIAERVAVAQPEVQANSKPNQNFEEVTTAEELNALPDGSVVLDVYGASVTKLDHSTWVRVTPAIHGGRMFHAPYLPARVLYRPVVDDA